MTFIVFFGTEFFAFEEVFWLLTSLCEVFLQTRFEPLFLLMKHEILSLEISNLNFRS
jgi:hypothetical protein